MYSVLLVDDDKSAVTTLARALNATLGSSASLFVATSAEEALNSAEQYSPQVAVIDLSLNPEEGVESGFQLLQSLQRQDSELRVLVLTGHGDTSFGVRAMKLGASNFIIKPADVPHLSALIAEAVRQGELLSLVAEQSDRNAKKILQEGLVGSSPAIQELQEQIRFAASSSQPILLEGETGVGKSLCARLIHRLSKREKAPFVRYQPGLSRSDVLASELFGHEKGSFTGAESARNGLLLHADGGTFFLDEIDGLPLETQTGLLGVLQEKTFRRVGADQETLIDVRFLSATNAQIETLVESGSLRKDFFHRLAQGRIRIPPLRERKEDIQELVRVILLRLEEREEVAFMEFADETYAMLLQHDWPGNIRELEGVIEGASSRAQFAGRTEVVPEDVKISCSDNRSTAIREGDSLQIQVAAFKKARVIDVLAQQGDNQVKAAKALGIDRTTLRRILQG